MSIYSGNSMYKSFDSLASARFLGQCLTHFLRILAISSSMLSSLCSTGALSLSTLSSKATIMSHNFFEFSSSENRSVWISSSAEISLSNRFSSSGSSSSSHDKSISFQKSKSSSANKSSGSKSSSKSSTSSSSKGTSPSCAFFKESRRCRSNSSESDFHSFICGITTSINSMSPPQIMAAMPPCPPNNRSASHHATAHVPTKNMIQPITFKKLRTGLFPHTKHHGPLSRT